MAIERRNEKMKILYLCNSDEYNAEVTVALKDRGHGVETVIVPDEDYDLSKEMLENKQHKILKCLENDKTDVVFSLEFYPCISALCEYYQVVYVCWILEPPYSKLYFSSVLNETNLIFLADKQMAEELQAEGIETVFYLPKGVCLTDSPKKGDNMLLNLGREEGKQTEECLKEEEPWKVSFVGKLKDKSWEEYFGAEELRNSTKGYLDGMVACQRHIYGLDFFSKILPEYVLKDLMEQSTIAPAVGSVESLEHYYREQCFYPKMTVTDRRYLVDTLSILKDVRVFSDDESLEKEGIINWSHMEDISVSEVVRKSKININVTPRGYRDGLYGNILEILGMGGFLISDYRPELEKEFVAGEEIVIYEDVIDLLNKISYYTVHEEERKKIAQKGYEKVIKLHTLQHRLDKIERKINEYVRGRKQWVQWKRKKQDMQQTGSLKKLKKLYRKKIRRS